MLIFFNKMNSEERNGMIIRGIHNSKGGFILLLFSREAYFIG